MKKILKEQQKEDSTAHQKDTNLNPQDEKKGAKVSSHSLSILQNVNTQSLKVGNITQSISQSFSERPDFFERKDLHFFGSENFPRITDPGFRNYWESLVHSQTSRVLVIAGNHEDKADITLHIAELIREHFSDQARVSIYEWGQTSSNRLLASIRGDGEQDYKSTFNNIKVFILPRLLPQHISNDLQELWESAQHGQSYVLAYTDVPYQRWVMPSHLHTNVWWEPGMEIFQSKDITTFVVRDLQRKQIALDRDLVLDLYAQIHAGIKTISRAKELICILVSESKPLIHENICQAIEKTNRDRKILLKKWFLDDLNQHDQFLVIGITLFKGLFIDQFFAILERVIANVWQKREPSLRASDHGDLMKFGNYCKTSSVSYTDQSNDRLVELIQRDDGRVLLALAWESHQRQIVSALEEVAGIVKQFIKKNFVSPSDLELFGSRIKTNKLRSCFKQTLVEIGLIYPRESINSIQNILLSLAQNESYEIKNITAETLSDWYNYDESQQQVLEIFKRFYDYSGNSAYFSGLEIETESESSLQDNARSTVAIALGYAIAANEPGLLSSDLYKWLEKIAKSDSKTVLAHFESHTLRYTIDQHFADEKIQLFLKKIAQINLQDYPDYDLGKAVATNLARKYSESENLQECKAILELLSIWVKEAESQYPKNIPYKGSQQDYLLRTVALTYGEISINPKNRDFDNQKALDLLSYIVLDRKPRHSLVRESINIAICARAKKELPTIEHALRDLLGLLTINFQEILLSSLKEAYLEQRKQLKDGETKYKDFPVWIDTKRPLTFTEIVLLRWLDDEKHPIAQKFATRAFIKFAEALDEDEYKFIQETKKAQQEKNRQERFFIEKVKREKSIFPKFMLTYTFYAWLAAWDKWSYLLTVRNILPEAFKFDRENRERVNFVIRRWKEVADQHKRVDNIPLKHNLKETSSRLRKSLFFRRNFLLTSSIAILFLGLIYLLIGNLIARMILGERPGLPGKVQTLEEIESASQNSGNEGDEPFSNQSEDNRLFEDENFVESDNSIENNFTSSESSNPFRELIYPLDRCGNDPPTAYSNDYPLAYYPVYINYNEYDLNAVKNKFCWDAFPKEYDGRQVIQVASFRSYKDAQLFREFMYENFLSGEVGEPKIFESPE